MNYESSKEFPKATRIRKTTCKKVVQETFCSVDYGAVWLNLKYVQPADQSDVYVKIESGQTVPAHYVNSKFYSRSFNEIRKVEKWRYATQ